MANFYDVLKNSPMFQLSLASKELFHSNFLAWIGSLPFDKGKEHPFRKVMFELGATNALDDSWGEDWYVAREYKNFDLCVLSEKPLEFRIEKTPSDEECKEGGIDDVSVQPRVLLVLENKLKSIPYKKQLDEYFVKVLNMSFAEVKDKDKTVNEGGLCYMWQLCPKQVNLRIAKSTKARARKYRIEGDSDEYTSRMRSLAIDKVKGRTDFLLLSMATEFQDKDAVKNEGLWKLTSYNKYLRCLKKLQLEGYYKLILEDYCKQLECIQNLHNEWTSNLDASKFLYFDKDDEGKWIFRKDYSLLRELRIHDLYHKQRQAYMCNCLRTKLDDAFKENELKYRYLSFEEFANANKKEINIHLNSGLIHGVPVLDLWLVTGQGFCYMIQVQGDHYQHGFRWLGTKYKDKYDELWQRMTASYGWWVEAPDLTTIFELRESAENKDSYDGRYNNKDCTDVYKYWRIKTSATVKDVLSYIVDDFISLCKKTCFFDTLAV